MFVELNKQAETKAGKPLIIRSIRSDDGELLGAFFASIPAQDRYYFYPHDLDIAHGYSVVGETANDRSIRIIATIGNGENEQIVGYNYVQDKGTGVPFGFGICIDNRYQSEGVGGLILQELLEQVRVNGIETVTLTVHQDNSRALSLYRKAGFKVTGEFVNEPQGSQAYSMKLEIEQDNTR